MTKMMAGYQEGTDVDVTRAIFEAARGNLQRLAFLGLSERFADSLQLFCRTLGCSTATPESPDFDTLAAKWAELTKSERAVFDRTNRWDVELYRRAVELFESRWTEVNDGGLSN